MAVFDGTDACTTPVLTLSEAPSHPHNTERGVFDGPAEHQLPSRSPRFDSTPDAQLGDNVEPGANTAAILGELGWDTQDINALLRSGAAS